MGMTCARFYSRSHDAVIRVYDEEGNVIERREYAGEIKEWLIGCVDHRVHGLLSEMRGVTDVSDMVESRPKTTYAVILLWGVGLLCPSA